jgi:DNA-directed RNA polymerase specialized sigma24 family protein
MDGATLRLLDSLQGVTGPGGQPTVTSLEAFARLLAGRAHAESDAGWVHDLAVQALKHFGNSRAEPFRFIYESILTRGYEIDLTDNPRQWEALALEGLLSLPLRERAALSTTCVLGFTSDEVGKVIGTTASHARAIVDGAVALIRREAGLDRKPRTHKRRATPAA